MANGNQGETFKKKWNLVTLKDIKKGEELTFGLYKNSKLKINLTIYQTLTIIYYESIC